MISQLQGIGSAMNEKLLLKAVELAADKSRDGKCGPFGAIVARDGEIISEGWNQVTGTPDPTAHGEIVAIRKACLLLGTHSLEGCELYSSCQPCPMCMAAAHWARLDAVYFASDARDAADAGFDDDILWKQVEQYRRQTPTAISQACRDKAREVFDSWINNPDKQPY